MLEFDRTRDTKSLVLGISGIAVSLYLFYLAYVNSRGVKNYQGKKTKRFAFYQKQLLYGVFLFSVSVILLLDIIYRFL